MRRRRRRPIKRTVVVMHRWISLVLGTLLLVITTSGAVVLYTPEWTAWSNPGVFDVADPRTGSPLTFEQALAAVDAAHPRFGAGSVNAFHGVYEVSSRDADAHPGFYGVDPTTGRVTGYADTEHGFMALMNQVHECFFTCEGYPAYLTFLTASVPDVGIGWLDTMTWSGVALGLGALMLLFLAASGVWLWWPTLKKWRHGFRVRWSKGRYARDYDLHQVIGMAAVPFLLMWGLTGANFEFTWVSTAWYAVTGGHAGPDETFTSTKPGGAHPADIGFARAESAARSAAGPGRPLISGNSPAAGDATGVYTFWFADGYDTWKYAGSPGDYGIDVDAHDASRTHVEDYSTADTVSNQLLDVLGAPTFHYGQSVNGWWRMIWLAFGLSPLVLALTGVSTWLSKRSVRKRRARLTADRGRGGDPTAPTRPASPVPVGSSVARSSVGPAGSTRAGAPSSSS